MASFRLTDIVRDHARDRGAQTALTGGDRSVTYAELEVETRAFAAYLQGELGLKKGDRLAIMMPNILQYPVVLFGALRAGVIVVNVNPLYTGRELRHQLVDSGATTIVIVANFAHVLAGVLSETPVEHVIVQGEEEGTIAEDHAQMLRSVLEFKNRVAR